jgi:hypothetical protein
MAGLWIVVGQNKISELLLGLNVISVTVRYVTYMVTSTKYDRKRDGLVESSDS